MHSERYHHLCLRESGLADETTQPLAFELVRKTWEQMRLSFCLGLVFNVRILLQYSPNFF